MLYLGPDTFYWIKTLQARKTILSLSLAAFAGTSLHAASGSVGTTSAAFLKLGSGGRPAALADAYVAEANDSAGVVFNPAGMAQMLSGEIAFTHTEWFQGMRFENVNAVFSLGDGGMMGATFNFLAIPPITRTEEIASTPDPALNFREIGEFRPFDLQAAMHYARQLSPNLAGGATLKTLAQNIDNKSTFGVAVDLGAQYKTKWKPLRLGLAIQNLGTPVKLKKEAFGLPINIRAGAALRFVEDKLLVLVEADAPLDIGFAVSTGVEYSIAEKFFPRLGYRFNPALAQEHAWTAGVGVKRNEWGLDLSAVPFGELGLTYRATVNYSFGQPGASISSIVPYLSTTGSGSPAVISTRVGGRDKVTAWGMYIYHTARGAKPSIVKKTTGSGPPPKDFIWDGTLDNGSKAVEGSYFAILTARYTTGNVENSEYLRLEVDNSPPKIDIKFDKSSVVAGGKNTAYVPTQFIPRSLDRQAVARWRLEIMDAQGNLFRSIRGLGEPPKKIIWDGLGDDGSAFVSNSVYQVRYWVKDPLGNEALNPAPVSFRAVFR